LSTVPVSDDCGNSIGVEKLMLPFNVCGVIEPPGGGGGGAVDVDELDGEGAGPPDEVTVKLEG
jgi:hypothetical protein